MKHLLMHPAYPDIVRQSADEREGDRYANDNSMEVEELSDPLLIAFARAEIAATRCW